MRTNDGFLLVFDLSNKKTFNGMEEFRTQIIRSKDTNNPALFIAANKCDLPEDKKVVTTSDIATLCSKWKVNYLETSAKNRTNVDEVFMEIIKEVVKRKKKKIEIKNEKKKCTMM